LPNPFIIPILSGNSLKRLTNRIVEPLLLDENRTQDSKRCFTTTWEKSWFKKVRALPSGWWNNEISLWCYLNSRLDLSAMNKRAEQGSPEHVEFMGWVGPSRLSPSLEQILLATIRFSGSPLRFVELRPGFANSPRPEE